MNKAVPDGSVSNIRSLIHLVILQSLGDTLLSSKEPYKQTDRQTDRQTHRHTDTQTHRAYKWLQVSPFNQSVNVGNDKLQAK